MLEGMSSPPRLGKSPRATPGFSLVELLCVMVILIILAVMMDVANGVKPDGVFDTFIVNHEHFQAVLKSRIN